MCIILLTFEMSIKQIHYSKILIIVAYPGFFNQRISLKLLKKLMPKVFKLNQNRSINLYTKLQEYLYYLINIHYHHLQTYLPILSTPFPTAHQPPIPYFQYLSPFSIFSHLLFLQHSQNYHLLHKLKKSMNQVSSPSSNNFPQTTQTFLQSLLLQNIFDRQGKQELDPEKQQKPIIKFSVEGYLQSIENSQVLKLRANHESSTLIAKITPKFQNDDFCFFHQSSQVNFMKKIIGKSTSSIIKIQNVFFHRDKLITIMDYACAGDLTQYVSTNSFLMTQTKKKEKINWVRNIIKQIVNGLQTIHNLDYVYRDLKPQNILVNHDGNVKICDFGFVIQQGVVDPSFCGTPDYMAPERISEKKKNTPIQKSVDMWSLGVLTFQLLTGETPYSYEGNTNQLLNEIYNGYISFDEQFPEYVSHFILNLLQPNPKKRFTLQQVKDHKFLAIQSSTAIEKWWNCKCDN